MNSQKENPKIARLNAAKKRMEERGAPQDNTLSSQLAELNEAGKDNWNNIRIDVSAIKKVFNPRSIPFPLELIADIQWPSLDVPLDKINVLLKKVLLDLSLFRDKSDTEKEEVLDFFCNIHTLAQSLQEDNQLQNIIVYRYSPTDTSFVLIAGERRVIACLYAGIRFIYSRVYNNKPSTLKISRIVDSENSAKALKAYERVVSKKGIWDALGQDAKELTNTDLQVVLGMNGTYCSWLKQIFTHRDHDAIMRSIINLRMGWREIQALLEKKGRVLTVKTNNENSNTDGLVNTRSNKNLLSTVSLKKQNQTISSFGIHVNRNTNLCFLKESVSFFKHSNKISSPTKQLLVKLDKDNYKEMIEAINAVCKDLSDNK